MQRDDIFVFEGRTLRVDTIFTDEDGDMCSIVAECLEPREGDQGRWWAIEITEDDCEVVHNPLH